MGEESALKAKSQKQLRELEAQMNELGEDLEAEKEARVKAEKGKRDLNEELEALKNELLDNLDSTAAQQELRIAREKELVALKKSLEDGTSNYESLITDMRRKHGAVNAELNDQLDHLKRIKSQLEKQTNQLKAENDRMTNELKTVSGSKIESDRKRKHIELQAN